MNPEWDFDFSVRVSTHVVSATPGQSIQVPAMVQLHRGVPKPVVLTVSTGLAAQIVPPTVIPAPGAVATLHIMVAPGTPPGSYMTTVRAETSGTFKTSQDAVTVVVTESKEPPEDNEGDGQGEPPDETPAPPAPAVAAAPLLARKARPVSLGQRRTKPQQHRSPVVMRLFCIMMLVLGMGVIFYSVSQFSGISNDSGGSGTGTDTYAGTQTFSIASVMGNGTESSTGSASVQIDASGNVLGPVLYGKITNGTFTGEARTADATFPMTGTLSGGKFQASYHSSSVTWTWTLYKQ
jgi:hypothetical protein